MTSTVTDSKRLYQPLVSSFDISANNQVIGLRNRIINGGMRIDQRNVGSAVTIAAGGNAYIVDRFSFANQFPNAVTLQQVVLGAGGAAPPKIPTVNHVNALQWTNSSTATTSTTVQAYFQQAIEANACIDFGWGNTTPKSITISFWVYTSIVGTYSLNVLGNGNTATYITTYTVTNANSWQFVVATVPGPTVGTWATDTSLLFYVNWFLHGSTSTNATANLRTWIPNSTAFMSTTQTNIGATPSSTFAITGVQLELGSIPTVFEWRPWETEMRMCQRYYEKSYDYAFLPGSTNSGNRNVKFSTCYNTSGASGFSYMVEKRIAPGLALYNATGGVIGAVNLIGGASYNASANGDTGAKGVGTIGISSGTTGQIIYYHYVISAEF